MTTVLLAGCSGSDPKPEPTVTLTPNISDVKVYKGLSHDHLKKGQYPQAYEQSPPVGGPHAPAWLKCAVYDEPVPNEAAVHSQEHGGIWITYTEGLPAAEVETLAMLAKTNSEFVLVSPYAEQSEPIVASTWGLQLAVQLADDPRLLDFIRTYAGGEQGGEKGVGCAKTGATLAEVKELIAQK